MSEVRTVRELYERERERLKALWARTNPELILKDGSLLNDAEAVVAESVVEALMDYHVLPASGAVVAAETVEACATIIKAGFNIAHAHAGEIDGDEFCQTLALAVLAAADIEVPDEVVEVRADSRVTVGFDTPERAVMISLERGDTLYIVRAVTADCHSKEE